MHYDIGDQFADHQLRVLYHAVGDGNAAGGTDTVEKALRRCAGLSGADRTAVPGVVPPQRGVPVPFRSIRCLLPKRDGHEMPQSSMVAFADLKQSATQKPER
ncbi:hypothetical protein TNCT1_41900 [Streptomyces sp. 1-11]|nr:hypothetical protein TNCT1_41900 [Streptomyces sp. 1-11]